MEETDQKPGNALVSFVGRGSSDKGDNWPRRFEGEVVPSGSDDACYFPPTHSSLQGEQYGYFEETVSDGGSSTKDKEKKNEKERAEIEDKEREENDRAGKEGKEIKEKEREATERVGKDGKEIEEKGREGKEENEIAADGGAKKLVNGGTEGETRNPTISGRRRLPGLEEGDRRELDGHGATISGRSRQPGMEEGDRRELDGDGELIGIGDLEKGKDSDCISDLEMGKDSDVVSSHGQNVVLDN
ncbi:cylicin-2-like [Rosa chinensis]|uniref:cylicin-2-like n=1 Tax=Rosa chinensis TaxID=74649 RepID=UPI000D08DD40|nr:cylicin-2-like [Rosa chinensis]